MSTPDVVAVIDDDPRQAETVAELLIDAGYSPILVPRTRQLIASASDLAREVQGCAGAAICDHRLSPGNLAHFFGAEAVATLYDMKIPALLLTQYSEMDIDVSIRRWRDKVPVVLTRDEADSSMLIRTSLDLCTRELHGEIAPARRAYRSLVRVSEPSIEGTERVIDVFVLQWRPHAAVRLPLECLPEPLRATIAAGDYFIAEVNLDAKNAGELYFRAFEVAHKPAP